MHFDFNYIKIAGSVLKQIVGKTFPNPPVVSILVESDFLYKVNKIVSLGITSVSGRPHAEYNAIHNFTFKKKKIIRFIQHSNHVVIKGEESLVFQKSLIQNS